MERKEIPIRFADLRRLAREVPTWLAAQAGTGKTPALKAEVESSFGMAGLDTEELILSFATEYRVDYYRV